MDSLAQIGAAGIAMLILLLVLRVPVGIALILVGFVGTSMIIGFAGAISSLTTEPFLVATNDQLLVIPMFVLMGNLATVSGLSRDLYQAAYAWVGFVRGGLAKATILTCAGFAALSGSSVASAVTVGTVALPEMKRFGYDNRLATGSVAAGGTLGILIPPSTGLVLYAILTESSIGKLFLAGFVPGLLLAGLFILTIYLLTLNNPALGPAGEKLPLVQRAMSTIPALPMIIITVTTIGGIYTGIFTVTEAAAMGAFFVLAVAALSRRLSFERLGAAVLDTIKTTGFIFLIIIGAHVFAPFLALTEIPQSLGYAVSSLDVAPIWILVIILLCYVVLGMFLEGFAILVLTLPIVHPVITGLGYDTIWFGIVMVIILEMGLISPPVGVNVFVVKGVAPDVSLREIFLGILPFWIAMGICLAIIVTFPQIALYLPTTVSR